NRIRTDAQRKRDDGDRRKSGRLAQHANPEAEIFYKDLDHRYASGITAFLRRTIHAAKFHASLTLGFRRVAMLPSLHFEVKLQFVLEVLLNLTAENQGAQSKNDVLPHHLKPSPMLLVSNFYTNVSSLMSNVNNNRDGCASRDLL